MLKIYCLKWNEIQNNGSFFSYSLTLGLMVIIALTFEN